MTQETVINHNDWERPLSSSRGKRITACGSGRWTEAAGQEYSQNMSSRVTLMLSTVWLGSFPPVAVRLLVMRSSTWSMQCTSIQTGVNRENIPLSPSFEKLVEGIGRQNGAAKRNKPPIVVCHHQAIETHRTLVDSFCFENTDHPHMQESGPP